MELDDINTVAVLGAGNMGHGIAEVAAMAGFEVTMRDIDEELVQSGYDDIEAMQWTPGRAIADKCPQGDRLVDTGWSSMLQGGEGIDAYRRTVFCRKHGYARIYVISGPVAAEHGWEPEA